MDYMIIAQCWLSFTLQNHPKYLNGELTEEELYNKFLANFETNKLVGDNVSLNHNIQMLAGTTGIQMEVVI